MVVNVSCVIITIFIIVSAVNLFLLLHVIMQSLKICGDNINSSSSSSKETNKKIAKIQQFHSNLNIKTSINKYKFMTAIIQLKPNDEIKFICSASIISKNWALTPAHCAELLIKTPIIQLRIAGNSTKWKYGIWHDLDKIIIHERFDSLNLLNDISLISVKQPFKGKNEVPVSLPNGDFKYFANSTAFSLGWTKAEDDEHLYGVSIKLFWYKLCEIQYPTERVLDNGKLCAGREADERMVCTVDYGGQLMQKNMLIAVMSFGVGCEGNNYKPGVYTKVSYYENWIRYVEKTNGVTGKAVFKSKP